MRVVVIGTYELGRQSFGLASLAAWLTADGHDVRCLDLAVEELDESAVAEAALIALHLPMHTATRLAATLMPRLQSINASAHYCAFGLYAPMNEPFLRSLGVQSVLGGEIEESLVHLASRLAGRADAGAQVEAVVSLSRLDFRVPDRSGLPPLERYARVRLPGGQLRTVGYTESTRGCRHLCRHCPVVPVYGGKFRVVPRDVVVADVEQQVAAGARHITFGDPDFLNAPGHAFALVNEVHQRFPDLTYDATIKVEHLVRHIDNLETLRDTGCLFVTSAVESVDDTILGYFDKSHTRAQFVAVAERCRAVGLTLNPTFVTFTPWTTLDGYLELLDVIEALSLVNNVSPIQYAIRLLVPEGSLLLELPEMTCHLRPYNPELLSYPWVHPDPRVDQLQQNVTAAVGDGDAAARSRAETFALVRQIAHEAAGRKPARRDHHQLVTDVPFLTEPWYCCAEPTDRQFATLVAPMDPRL